MKLSQTSVVVPPTTVPTPRSPTRRRYVRTRLALTSAVALLAGGFGPVPMVAASQSPAVRYVPGDVVVTPRHGAATVLHVNPSEVGATVRSLRRRPDLVADAAPNPIAHAAAEFFPNDPGTGTGWQALQWNFIGPFSVGAPAAWAHAAAAGAPGGRGTTIAVLDSGVAYRTKGRFARSPDFSASDFVAGYDFVGDDPYPEDHNGHGTHVASTIGEATNNRVGLTGLAYGARIMPIRVLNTAGEGDAMAIARGVRFATRQGADVINLSLEFPPDLAASEIPELLDALRDARRAGVVIVAAAGNEGVDGVSLPARASSVIAVGATTNRGCLSEFSNTGTALDLVAPGGGQDADGTGDPNCQPLTSGLPVFALTFVGGSVRRFGLPGSYEGTSMAAPHVAATAALIIATKVLGAHPTVAAIEQRLKQTSRDLGPPGYDRRYGEGLVDAAAATNPP